MMTISPSKLNIYLECPRHYWWQYINPATKGKQPIRPYFTMGSHVHTALKLFFAIKPEFRTKEKLMNLLASQWQKCPGRHGGFWDSSVEEEYRTRAQLMLSAFYNNEDMKAVPLWAKDNLVQVPVSETLIFNGKLDRVDEELEGLHIIDYKTGREEREDEWQLPMYAVLASRFFGKPVTKLSYLFLETGAWHSVPANPARESWIISRVQAIVDAMPTSFDRQDWPCPDGEACSHCDYLKEFGIDPLDELVVPGSNGMEDHQS